MCFNPRRYKSISLVFFLQWQDTSKQGLLWSHVIVHKERANGIVTKQNMFPFFIENWHFQSCSEKFHCYSLIVKYFLFFILINSLVLSNKWSIEISWKVSFFFWSHSQTWLCLGRSCICLTIRISTQSSLKTTRDLRTLGRWWILLTSPSASGWGKAKLVENAFICT